MLEHNGGTPRWPYDNNTYESYIAQQMIDVSRTDVLTVALHKLGHGIGGDANESEQAAVERLRRRIEVTREGTSYQFSVGARGRSPDDAAKMANTVAAAYIESATGEQKAGDTAPDCVGRGAGSRPEGADRRPHRAGSPEQATGPGVDRNRGSRPLRRRHCPNSRRNW